MKNYLSVSDLEMNDTHERGNVSVWVYAPEMGVMHIECGECKEIAFSATPYCPYCGSLMYNYKTVAKQYKADCERTFFKIEKKEGEDK